jgi:hypothetical protein
MLLERAAQLAIQVKQFNTTNELAQEAAAFATRVQQLAGPSDELLQLSKLAAEFAQNSITIPFDRALGLGVVQHAGKLLEAFTANPKSLTEGDEFFRHQFLPGIRKLSQTFRAALEEGWRQRVDRELDALPQDVLAALETVAKYRAQIQTIRRCDQEAKQSRLTLPLLGTVAARLAALAQIIKVKEQCWQELKGSELPDEVIDFLKQAGTQGFSLADLTESIKQWLSERGLLGSFRIRSV